MLRLLLVIAAAAGLTACQSSMLRSFENVKPGMDKHQVLESLGSPSSVTRLHGKDRWIYNFYDEDVQKTKEVHFEDGRAVYVGDAWTPPPEKSAALRDKANDDKEQVFQAEAKARDDARRKNADLYREYEESAHNKAKVKYMPTFVEQ